MLPTKQIFLAADKNDSCKENVKPNRIDPDSYCIEDFHTYKKRVKGSYKKDSASELNQNRLDSNVLTYESSDKSDDEDSEDDDLYGNYYEHRIIDEPEQISFSYHNISENKVNIDLSNSRLQVIVKLANIILTPEKPKFKGGHWHVEGMQNEDIVATGIYYYDQENVSESSLAFRAAICEPEYEQDDHRGVIETFSIQDNLPLNQYLGSVSTHKGRCLAFPNLYQHRVEPFELQDKTIMGFRKILCFFLVNPNNRIYSTANIPPQQKYWFKQEILGFQSKLSLIPEPVFNEIFEFLRWPIDLNSAKKYREKLMDERKYYLDSVNKDIFERPFSLCEH
ncbi:hypothetical protein BB561_005345 [Smittium simulii]|uniref:DUF4246 domain-containing protein n=1 Tax=Smittium simulii TaxID=133385 RepID=A0A2T9YAU5_9FUNG|nr:hypothetical protein BB561_005345 [Smittium simulii]